MSGHEHHHTNSMETTTAAPYIHDHTMGFTSHDMDHSGHSGHAGHSGHDMGDMGGMMMYFHARVKETILFESWDTDTIGGLVGSMIGIFLMALFYEGLKYYREYLFRKTYASANFNCIGLAGEGPKVLPNPLNSVRHRMLHPSHLIQTFLHMFQVTLSYFLMLIFMTYNVWLCLAVVLGAGTGFFIFGWKKAIVVDITEHCH